MLALVHGAFGLSPCRRPRRRGRETDMAQQTGFVQESVDRVRESVASIESDFEKVQARVRKQLRARGKEIDKRRKSLERETQKRVKRFRKEFEKNRYVKRAQSAFDDASKQVEKNVESVLGVLNVASKRDVGRIDRKLNQINRKLREIEKAEKADTSVSAASSN
jgi:hypothetical protein